MVAAASAQPNPAKKKMDVRHPYVACTIKLFEPVMELHALKNVNSC
jgi:hypothetical protein